jgi:hypothetical protein
MASDIIRSTITGEYPINYAINTANYDIVVANLERKGIQANIARILAYEVLIIANITEQSYNRILSKINAGGLALDKELIDQLNLLRTSGNKLGFEGTANMNKFVARAIV